MLKLIIPKVLLEFIDNNRSILSRPTYILKCVNYIMINNINLNNEGECNAESNRPVLRGQNDDHNRM